MNGFCVILESRCLRRVLATLLAVALLLSVLRLIPPLRERCRLQDRLQAAQKERIAQMALQPLFAELTAQAQAGTWNTLVPPEQVRLQNAEVAAASTYFEQLTQSHGFTLGRIRLRVLPPPPQRRLSVDLPMQGTYTNFGPLLKELLLLPTLQNLDRITMRLEHSVEQFTVELKLALE